MALAGVCRSDTGFYSSPCQGCDEGLWRPGVQDGDHAVAGGGDRATVDFDSGGKGCVIDGNNTTREATPMFGENERKRSRGVCVGGDGGDGSVGTCRSRVG